MSEQNPFDWAERAGKETSERESAIRIKQDAEEAEKATQRRVKGKEETEFKKKSTSLSLLFQIRSNLQ
jgi:hypothetical protein